MCGDEAPCVLRLTNRLRNPVRLKFPCTHWIGAWVGPRSVLDVVAKRILTLPGIEFLFFKPQPVMLFSSLERLKMIEIFVLQLFNVAV
jgi:hypothetical protein